MGLYPEPAIGAAVAERVAQVEQEPGSAEAWGRLGIVYDIHDFHTEAIQCYQEARARDPNDYRWVFLMGICKNVGDQQGALAHLEEAARLNPGYAPIHVNVGRGQLLAERLVEAEQAEASVEHTTRLQQQIEMYQQRKLFREPPE